ncbi:MAG: precorrin-3B synthase [Solirubrobacterales bacterium]|nr:precorrin-3B synthase [Solirubrobacterales bacterium]
MSGRTNEDRCPDVLGLHAAEDGHLARIRVPGGRLDAAQIGALAAASERGNGIAELTGRANMQIRGLSGGAGRSLAQLLGDGGFAISPTHEHARNILASPLAGRHPTSLTQTDALVDMLDRELQNDTELSQLSGRFLFAIDDGSSLAGGQNPDVALIAEAHGAAGLALRLELGGCPTELVASANASVALAIQAARAFLELQVGLNLRAWRLNEIESGPEQVAERLCTTVRRSSSRTARGLDCGSLEQRDGNFAVTAMPPLGRMNASVLERLSKLLRAEGRELRLSPARTLSIVDVPADRVEPLQQELSALGLAVAPCSGWEGLSACAGRGACANALIDVRAAAARRAGAANRRVRRPATEHWSACERRCGEPKGAEMAVAAEKLGLRVRTRQVNLLLEDVDSAVELLDAESSCP